MKHLYIVACPVYIGLNCQFISNAWYQGWTQILPFYMILLISTWLSSDIAVCMRRYKTRDKRLRTLAEHVADADYMVEKNFQLAPYLGLFNASVTNLGFKRCFHIPKISGQKIIRKYI